MEIETSIGHDGCRTDDGERKRIERNIMRDTRASRTDERKRVKARKMGNFLKGFRALGAGQVD